MDQRLRGKVAVITGGTSGIGASVASRFVAEGSSVMIGAPPGAEADQAISSLRRSGGDVEFVATDVRLPTDVDRLVGKAEQRFGHVDIAYASAGVLVTGSAAATSDEMWRRVIDVNLAGSFFLARSVIPAMHRSGGGTIVLTASELGLVGARETVAYCAAKGGVINMTRALAIDCAAEGIRVNCLAPGPVDTPMLRGWYASTPDPAATEAAQENPILLGRVAVPDEIAAAALFLASEDSSFMTGSILVVDGGATAWYGM